MYYTTNSSPLNRLKQVYFGVNRAYDFAANDPAIKSMLKQWDGRALYNAASEGDLVGVLNAIKQGVAVDGFRGSVSQ